MMDRLKHVTVWPNNILNNQIKQLVFGESGWQNEQVLRDIDYCTQWDAIMPLCTDHQIGTVWDSGERRWAAINDRFHLRILNNNRLRSMAECLYLHLQYVLREFDTVDSDQYDIDMAMNMPLVDLTQAVMDNLSQSNETFKTDGSDIINYSILLERLNKIDQYSGLTTNADS